MKYSVVMASFLGEYTNCASNREEKFFRAVNSFLNQDYKEKELIIVSDFCDITERIYNENFISFKEIKFFKLPEKSELFSGDVRNKGIEISSGERICYLDTDDFLGESHLTKINEQFPEDCSWVYYDDFLVNEFVDLKNFKNTIRENEVAPCKIGTSSICHSASIKKRWSGGYGHDWIFIDSLKNYKHKKISATSYNVCHVPYVFDI